MRKILFAILLSVMTLSAHARTDYKVSLIDTGALYSEYCDSLLSFRLSVSSKLGRLYVYMFSKTDKRITIEWENVRLQGSKIAFSTDYQFEVNRPHDEETVLPQEFTHKCILKRSGLPIVDKKKIKKQGYDIIYFRLPIRVGDEVYDISTEWKVEKEEK